MRGKPSAKTSNTKTMSTKQPQRKVSMRVVGNPLLKTGITPRKAILPYGA